MHIVDPRSLRWKCFLMVQDCIICAIQDTGGLDFPFKDVRMENGPKRLSDVDVSILESFNYVKEVHI